MVDRLRRSQRTAAAAAPRPVEVDVSVDRLGEGLGDFVSQLSNEGRGHSAPGGTVRLTAPEAPRPNNRVAPERSVELHFSPQTLYVHGFTVGGRSVRIRDGEERYPSRPLSILSRDELSAVIRNFHDFVEGQPKKRALEISLTHPPQGLDRLPDLVATLAEGARFPAIRKHIDSLERGGDGDDEVLEQALAEWDDRWATTLSPQERARYDFSRLIPSHFANNWERRFRDGQALFGLDTWEA